MAARSKLASGRPKRSNKRFPFSMHPLLTIKWLKPGLESLPILPPPCLRLLAAAARLKVDALFSAVAAIDMRSKCVVPLHSPMLKLTTSQMAGLEAKEKFMTNKIKYLAQEKYDQFCAIEESCREKMAAQKAESRRVLDEALATAVADAKKCRTDFVEAQLVKKEIVKGKLEDLLNIAIQNIKELKVEGIFADSGLPQEDHATAIAAAIEAEIDTFTNDSNNLLTQGTEPMGFTNILATDLTAFKDTEASDAEGSCLDVIRATFEIVWQGDAMAMPQTDATRGEKNIYDAAVEQCIDKMND